MSDFPFKYLSKHSLKVIERGKRNTILILLTQNLRTHTLIPTSKKKPN